MPLPWKKPKSGRITRFVSDLQQSPKHGGSLVVETGFPSFLIDMVVKNLDRLKKSCPKRIIKAQTQTAQNPRLSPPPSSLPIQRRGSRPHKLNLASITQDPLMSKIEESFDGGLTAENRLDSDEDGGGGVSHGGGACVLMVVVFKIFVLAVLALSTKKLTVGITLSTFGLFFFEFAVAHVFKLFNLCPDAEIRLDLLIWKLIGNRRQEKQEESSATNDRRNKISFEIVEESRDCSEEIRVPKSEKRSNWEDSSTFDKEKPLAEEKEVQTIRDVVFKNEKSKSSKLKSKIVKKIVPKKIRSYKKKKKMKKNKEKDEALVEEEEEGEEEEEEESVTEVSSLFSDDRIESEISERDEIGSNPPSLESCGEIEEEEEECGSKGDLRKAIVLIVIVLAGLLSGKVLAIGLTLSWCLILRIFSCRSQSNF